VIWVGLRFEEEPYPWEGYSRGSRLLLEGHLGPDEDSGLAHPPYHEVIAPRVGVEDLVHLVKCSYPPRIVVMGGESRGRYVGSGV